MISCNAKGDVSWNDSQQRFLAQHSITALLRHCFEWLQYCSNIATLCCTKYRRCQSSSVGDICNDDFLRNTQLQCWNNIVTIRNNIATLCCAKNRRCESPSVTIPLQNCSNIATLCCAEIRRFRIVHLKGDVTRNDSQRRYLALYSVVMLRQCRKHSVLFYFTL